VDVLKSVWHRIRAWWFRQQLDRELETDDERDQRAW
jgi:hypothetical protein